MAGLHSQLVLLRACWEYLPFFVKLSSLWWCGSFHSVTGVMAVEVQNTWQVTTGGDYYDHLALFSSPESVSGSAHV